MKCSYGVKTNVPFDKRRHAAKQMVLMDGEVKCDNIFSQIIEKDQMVEVGTKVLKSYFTPYPHQDVMVLPRIPVYRCHSNFRISEDIFNVNPALFRTCFRECNCRFTK
jgi:hypothetical protein